MKRLDVFCERYNSHIMKNEAYEAHDLIESRIVKYDVRRVRSGVVDHHIEVAGVTQTGANGREGPM